MPRRANISGRSHRAGALVPLLPARAAAEALVAFAVRSRRSVAAADPHPMHRIHSTPLCEGWAYSQARSPCPGALARRPDGTSRRVPMLSGGRVEPYPLVFQVRSGRHDRGTLAAVGGIEVRAV